MSNRSIVHYGTGIPECVHQMDTQDVVKVCFVWDPYLDGRSIASVEQAVVIGASILVDRGVQPMVDPETDVVYSYVHVIEVHEASELGSRVEVTSTITPVDGLRKRRSLYIRIEDQ